MFEILLQTTPNTNAYMIGGYIVFFVVMGIYLASLVLRRRSLQQDIATLEELEKTEQE